MFTGLSPELLTALATTGPDKAEVLVEVWSNGATPARTASFSPAGGNVKLARTGAVRGSCTVDLPDIEVLVPETEIIGEDRTFGEGTFGEGVFGNYRRRALTGLMVPLKTQLRVFWLFLPPGADVWETCPMGRFTVDEPAFEAAASSSGVRVTGFDCSHDIANAAWDVPFVIAEGTNVATAVAAIVANRLPGTAVSLPTTTATVPQLIFTPGYQGSSGNPWDDARAVARLAGWDLWVSRDGSVTGGVPADPLTGAAVWQIGEGNATRFTQTPSAADFINTVVVFGESSGEVPVVAVVREETGPYGTVELGRVVAREVRASNIRTVEEATNVGIAELHAAGALTDGLTGTSFMLPHLDPGDLIGASVDVLGLAGDVFRLDELTIPLGSADHTTPFTASRRLG